MNIGDRVKFPEETAGDLAGLVLDVIDVSDNINGQLLTLQDARGATCSAYAQELELVDGEIVDQPGVLP